MTKRKRGLNKNRIDSLLGQGEMALFQNYNNKINTDDPTKVIKKKMLKYSNGQPQPKSRKNIYLFLTLDPSFKNKLRFNSFNETIEYRRSAKEQYKPAGDELYSMIGLEIEQKYGFVPTNQAIEDGLIQASRIHAYNPIQQYIESTKWDGKKRVATFFHDYLGVDDSKYTRVITKTWFTGLIARAYQPGIKLDIVPILSGKQGIGKSTLLSSLAPKGYFEDGLQTAGERKDDLLKLHKSWIVELSELKAMKSSNYDQVKAFVSTLSDNYRVPYGHVSIDHPRQCVFIGTTNENEFLGDMTGNRRFFPLDCDKSKATRPIPDPNKQSDPYIMQVIAEAKHLYNIHHPLDLPKDIKKVAEQKQQEATIMDIQVEKMKDFASLLVPDDWKEFSLYQKRQYWQRAENEGRYATYKDKQLIEYSKDQLHPIKQFATTELLAIVFEEDMNKTGKGGGNSISSKVSLYFGDNPEWEKSNHINLSGKEKRGFKRQAGH